MLGYFVEENMRNEGILIKYLNTYFFIYFDKWYLFHGFNLKIIVHSLVFSLALDKGVYKLKKDCFLEIGLQSLNLIY